MRDGDFGGIFFFQYENRSYIPRLSQFGDLYIGILLLALKNSTILLQKALLLMFGSRWSSYYQYAAAKRSHDFQTVCRFCLPSLSQLTHKGYSALRCCIGCLNCS